MIEIGPLDVSCPTCLARKGRGCVYIWPRDWDGSDRVRYSWTAPAVLAMMDRAGTPTKRPHTDRYGKARLKEYLARRKAREAEYAAANALVDGREAILRANADAVLAEQRDLVAWLRENAGVLL